MDNINDIISSLSNDDIEMLKGVASSILGNETKENDINSSSKNILSNLDLNSDDLNMMLKAKSIFDRMNNTSSKNADLINALKPHLSEESQRKADTAIRILRIFEILPYIKDLFWCQVILLPMSTKQSAE